MLGLYSTLSIVFHEVIMFTGIVYFGCTAKESNNWTAVKDMFSVEFKECGSVEVLNNCGTASKEDTIEALRNAVKFLETFK